MSPLLPPFSLSPLLSIHQMRAARISMVSRVAADGRHYSRRQISQPSGFQTFIFFRYVNHMPQKFSIKPQGRSFFSSFPSEKVSIRQGKAKQTFNGEL